ncbi:hypothetical protein RhiJN_08469 [Ceratobasidium sp. AG-Ba]|nr:hypothetical protein RhiJN_08469 [Ceratobasidium sp. AG-Ba]QRW09254.1 hypothetical protein RhiLY_08253 [Ceratobasidium sp. AG-Ba]
MASAIPISPLTAQRSYFADLEKEEAAYAEAWWTHRRPNRRFSSGKHSPLRGSFSSDDVPSLDDSSQLTSPSSSGLATPAEYVQGYFDLAHKTREKYYKSWSTAVERRILGVHEARDSAIKISSPSRSSNLLAAQLDAFSDQQAAEDSYYEAWRQVEISHSAAAVGPTLLVHEARDPAIKIASSSSKSNSLAIQLTFHAKRREQEEAYDEAWIHAAQDGSLKTDIASTSSTPYHVAVQRHNAERRRQEDDYDQAWCDAVKNNSILGDAARASATNIALQTPHTNTLAAQLQAAKDQDIAEQAYADAWSRYSEITEHAQAIDAWKAHHLELLRQEREYYNVWTDASKTPAFAIKSSRPSAIEIGAAKYDSNPFSSQLVVFQDEHARQEQYDEAWIAYSNRHEVGMAPPVLRSPRLWSINSRRLSVSRSPRPAYTKRLPVDVATPELPMLGFSSIELVPENEGYVKSWVDKMKNTAITPANSVLLSPPNSKKTIPSSPRPKKRSNKGHFTWPDGITEEEKLGMTTRGNLQPYLSSLLGKIVSFEIVGQTTPSIPPDNASRETPMQITRRAHFKCQNNTICKIKVAVSITSPETARRYAHDPLPLFDALRKLGHAAVIQLDEVGFGKPNEDTGRQSIWRHYSVVSGNFRCEVTETFVDRRMFRPGGCDFGKRVVIKNGLIMSPDGTDYMALPL